MSNSSLICYKKISPNKSVPRNHAIDTISIHCMAGNLSVESCGNVFSQASRSASSNYGIGSDGRIAMYVEEKDRSWCTSSAANDNRAVTIEVANDGGATTGWHVSDKAMASLINLCADICKRNNIKKLLWKGDKSLIGQVSKQNMTVHRWFANKSCPGDYLYNKHSYIADEVNKKLGSVDVSAPITSSVFTDKLKKVTVNCNPYDEPTENISLNSTGEGACWVQWFLWRFGMYGNADKSNIDGVIGNVSYWAIKEAQKKLGLISDGIVGPETRKVFKSVVNL